MSRKYARITDYGDLLIPLGLLEKLLDQAVLVNTSYENGEDIITKVKKINRFVIYDKEEIDAALVQQALEGNEN